MRETPFRSSRARSFAPAVALFIAACSGHGRADRSPSFAITAKTIDAGASGGSVLRCATGGQACRPIAVGETIDGDALLKTTRGARGLFDLGGGADLDLSGESAVGLASSGDSRAIRVDAGLATATIAPGTELRVLDHVARASGGSATVAVLASAADRASITVRRGRVSLEGERGAELSLASGDSARVALGQVPDARQALEAAPVEASAPLEGERRSGAPRGLGAMTARVPGTEEIVPGVRLRSHRVAVNVRDGFARTEIEEEFFNTTARVLEGRYAFPLPPDASLSRLALWVGNDLVEGEIVPRARAATIFKSIVDDSVRPRDPALLEWVSGGEFALRIFPIPAHGSRKVVLAYNQALTSSGGRVRYVYPLSLGADRAAKIDDFSITVTAADPRAQLSEIVTTRYPATITTGEKTFTASFGAQAFTPEDDFEVSFQREGAAGAEVSAYLSAKGEFAEKGEAPRGFVALRVSVDLPADAPLPERLPLDRAIVIDASHSQSAETLAAEGKLALGLAGQMDPNERFVVLACDSACTSFPEDGLASASDASLEGAKRFVNALAPGGSSDVAGALLDAAHRLGGSVAAQAIYIGDGAPTSGELSAASISERVKPAMTEARVDLRLLGAGRTVDEVVLGGVARALGATYERVAGGESLEQRADEIAIALRRPVVRDATLELPDSIVDVYPKVLPNLRLGQEMLLIGRVREGTEATLEKGDVRIQGTLDGKPYVLARAVKLEGAGSFQNPLVPRLWAEARIAELEAANSKESSDEVVRLSRSYHVASRLTSLLVLENDAMFAEFGIARTAKHIGDQSDHVFGLMNGAPLASTPPEPSGMIGALRNGGPNGAEPWGGSAKDVPSARGNMWGEQIGDAFGRGGLGLSGVGEGGGGRGEGIGLGFIGSMGHAQGVTDGLGFGSGHGRLGGSHRTKPPSVRAGATSVSGRLPPEVIQRIVRMNFGRFRMCYERGLQRDPNLEGRVATRFVIGRDGSVVASTSLGSDLHDAGVVSCVVSAFRSLSFPTPEGGVVNVVYPLMFAAEREEARGSIAYSSLQGLGDSAFQPPKPSAFHRASDDAWRSDGAAAVQRLRDDALASPSSRPKLGSYVRGLLARGRFEEALTAAERFAALDPDSSTARELLAYARAASGDGPGALAALDAQVETAPSNVSSHLRAARAFEASGDERRACAHWRSLAELKPDADGYPVEALRCRARVLGDRDAALTEARTTSHPGTKLSALLAKMDAGGVPSFEDAAVPGEFEARIQCAHGLEHCGTLLVVTPSGTVLSPWTPSGARSSARSVAFSGLQEGTYRTLVVGASNEARGTVELRALGSVRKFELAKGGVHSIAATTISMPSAG